MPTPARHRGRRGLPAGRLGRPRFAPLERLQYGGPQLRRRNRILEHRHRAQPQRLLGPFGMETRKQQDDRDLAMLAPHVRQEFQCLGVERINAGQDQIDVVPLHQPDRHAVIGGLLDDVAQRLQHRGQQGQPGGVGIEDQDSELVHGIHLSACVRVRNTKPVHPP